MASITLDAAIIAPATAGLEYSPLLLGTGSNLTLTLMGESALTAKSSYADAAGIQTTGATLRITGDGTLRATGGIGGAGIGGNAGSNDVPAGDGGTVIIESGIIFADGNGYAAGIGGGGFRTRDGGNGGNITISGGQVTATGKSSGAGIGGGGVDILDDSLEDNNASNNIKGGDGGIITINNATVIATGGNNSAGIGGGAGGGNSGIITISGATTDVQASSNSGGAGIGGGARGDAEEILIESGTVKATGGYGGAGIGGGSGGVVDGESIPGGAGGNITISGGHVTATGGSHGAGIGGGGGGGVLNLAEGAFYGGPGGAGGNITISGGTVIAKGGGAGIGGGGNYTVNGSGGIGGTISISGADTDVQATGGDSSAGIGGGPRVDGGEITISGGKVVATATGNSGAGIGGGYESSGGAISISGAATDVTATGGANGAGIGSGNQGAIDSISISGGTVEAMGKGNGAGIGGGQESAGGAITIGGGTVTATGSNYGAGIGGGSRGDGGEINISGGTVEAIGGTSGGAGIGGGGAVAAGIVGNGGNVTISGGTVTATGGGTGAGIGIGNRGTVPGATFKMNDEDGGGLVFASSVSVTDVATREGGVLVIRNDATAASPNDRGTHWYGDEAFTQEYSGIVPTNYILTVNEGESFTIGEGVSLHNNGTVIEYEDGEINNVPEGFSGNKIQLIFKPRTVWGFVKDTLEDINIATADPQLKREGAFSWSQGQNLTAIVGDAEGSYPGYYFTFTPDDTYEDYYAVITDIAVTIELRPHKTEIVPPTATDVIRGQPLSESTIRDDGEVWVDDVLVPGKFVWVNENTPVDDDGYFPAMFWPDDTDTYGPKEVQVQVKVIDEITHRVTFNYNLGNAEPEFTISGIPHNAKIPLDDLPPEPEHPDGRTFIGWRKEMEDWVRYPNNESLAAIAIDTDYDLFAVWQEPTTPQPPTPPQPPQPPIRDDIGLTYIHAYLIGEGERHINPTGPITRAEVATVLMRVLTDETRAAHWTRDNPFHDVPNNGGRWYSSAISVAYAAGLMSGFPDGSFQPDASITRAEIAMAVSRLMCSNALENVEVPMAGYTDVPADHWANDAIDLVTKYGWMVGPGGGRFNPDAQMTRGEFATLMNRVLERTGDHVDRSRMILWIDNADPTAWFYWAVQVASNPSPNAPPMNWAALQLPDAEHDDVFS